MRILGLLAARMGSSRLPGKVLKRLGDQTVLQWCIRRASRSRYIDQLVVATTHLAEDNPIQELCDRLSVPVFRGEPDDVLDRFYQAAKVLGADGVVRLTGDDPFMDPDIIDMLVEAWRATDYVFDYVSNVIPVRTFPRGLDAELVRFASLETAWQQDTNPQTREHVTQYVVRHPKLFSIKMISHTRDCSHLRWTLDTAEDFAFFERVCSYLEADDVPWQRIARIVNEHPELATINAHVQQKTV